MSVAFLKHERPIRGSSCNWYNCSCRIVTLVDRCIWCPLEITCTILCTTQGNWNSIQSCTLGITNSLSARLVLGSKYILPLFQVVNDASLTILGCGYQILSLPLPGLTHSRHMTGGMERKSLPIVPFLVVVICSCLACSESFSRVHEFFQYFTV